jgi:hypothetical protein
VTVTLQVRPSICLLAPQSIDVGRLRADRLAERAVVIGDRALRQMVIKKEENETPDERRKRHIRKRLVYNV